MTAGTPDPRPLRRAARWLRAYLAHPGRQRMIAVAIVGGGLKWLWEDTLARLDELEKALALRGELKGLDDVATVGDLSRLKTEADGRFVARVPAPGPWGGEPPPEPAQDPQAAPGVP